MPPSPLDHTFVDEESKLEIYENICHRKAESKDMADSPGIRILCGQGLFVWMTMSWTDIAAADREGVILKGTCTTSTSEMVSMMASLIFQ